MYFIVLGGESGPTNKIGRPDPVALNFIIYLNLNTKNSER